MINFLNDYSNWHLSGVQINEADDIFDALVEDNHQVPEKELLFLQKDNREYLLDYLKAGGKNWLIEPLRYLQPQSFKVFEECTSNYKVGFRWYNLIPAPHLPKDKLDAEGFFIVNNRLIFVYPSLYGEVDALRESKALGCMPDVIANSWLKRTGGWGIVPIPHGMLNRQLIGHPHTSWQSAEWVLESYDINWRSLIKSIQDKVPNVYVTHYNPYDGRPSEWCSMRCFLDTRPYGLDGKCGDQFFVVDSRTDKVVYHIHDGDVKNLRVLEPEGVGEAIDAYCAHTLLRTEGRFDFLPWSKMI